MASIASARVYVWTHIRIIGKYPMLKTTKGKRKQNSLVALDYFRQ